MTCRHYKGGCTLGLYGGKPSPGVCRQCSSYSGSWRGAGDAVRAIVRILFLGRVDIAERIAARVESASGKRKDSESAPVIPGVSGGCGCKRRQDALNRAIPFGKD